MIGLKISAAVAAAATALTMEITTPFFGVPLQVITAAAAGSLSSFAYGAPVNPRKRLYGLAFANTFIGATSVGLLPGLLGWSWLQPEVEAPTAFFAAMLCRWIVPAVIDNVPAMVRRMMPRHDDKEKLP